MNNGSKSDTESAIKFQDEISASEIPEDADAQQVAGASRKEDLREVVWSWMDYWCEAESHHEERVNSEDNCGSDESNDFKSQTIEPSDALLDPGETKQEKARSPTDRREDLCESVANVEEDRSESEQATRERQKWRKRAIWGRKANRQERTLMEQKLMMKVKARN